ncbi:MAG: zinc ribbon-containing protein [Clostridia bacterium]|nr:zinc ribbon-containing protein [Clostridia bacterium]MDE7328160.1 zinc ribbon-containing protein [Clostridia bacterium]
MSKKAKINTGEKPGKGCYSCTNCGFDLRLDGSDKMPPCPNCNNTSFTKCGD